MLGEIYGVSVDELLGKEKTDKEDEKENKFEWEIVGMILVLGGRIYSTGFWIDNGILCFRMDD